MEGIRTALLGPALAAAAMSPWSPASAQSVQPDPGIEIVGATRGISKGLAQTDGPQLLVRAELRFGAPFVGLYAKNVTSSGDEGLEAGPLIGAHFGWSGFQLTASAAWKRLEGISGPVDDEALELVLGASRSVTRHATARASLTWSPDELGSTRSSAYWEAGLSIALGRGTTASGNIGRRERSGGPDYTSFNLGVTQQLRPGISADLRLYDTAQSDLGETFRRRLVASVRARF